MDKISSLMISKDTTKNILRASNNVKNYVDEMIIADSGSLKETIKEVKKIGARVYPFIWQNNFAKARNFALSKCSGEWILVIDSDEEYCQAFLEKLRDLVKDQNFDGYKVGRIHYIDEERPFKDYWSHLRLYRNKKGQVYYYGSIHETLNGIERVKELDKSKYFIKHHNSRKKERQKALNYLRDLNKSLVKAKEQKNIDAEKYFQYKFWVQKNIYIPETDPNVDLNKLKKLYQEYEVLRKKTYAQISVDNIKA